MKRSLSASELEPAPRLKWISKLLVRAYFKLFHQYEALGVEHLPPHPPVLALTNHVSNLDVPAFALADPYVGSCLIAKASLVSKPILREIMFSWGAIPVARDGRDSSALREVLGKLREGRLVAIASEGTRNRDGWIGETNPVLARLAIQASASGIPLVPVAASGTYECLPRGTKLPKPGKVRVLIGPQFSLAHLKRMPREEGVEEARQIIRERLLVMMESRLPIAPPIVETPAREPAATGSGTRPDS